MEIQMTFNKALKTIGIVAIVLGIGQFVYRVILTLHTDFLAHAHKKVQTSMIHSGVSAGQANTVIRVVAIFFAAVALAYIIAMAVVIIKNSKIKRARLMLVIYTFISAFCIIGEMLNVVAMVLAAVSFVLGIVGIVFANKILKGEKE